MRWADTKSKALAGAVGLALIGAAIVVKLMFFPSLKEDYFTMNERSLHAVPFGFAVVRPTHFPKSSRKGVIWGSVQRSGKPVWRMMGRDVTLQELFGVAYGQGSDRVVLPLIAPKTNFDFLVTIVGDQRQQLQATLRKSLGLVAHTETRDTPVLALKVQEAGLTGMKISEANAKQNVNFENGKLHVTHLRIEVLMQGLEQAMKLPVVDKSNLTNYYDFSVDWGRKMQEQLQNQDTAEAAVRNLLAGLGLRLDPDEAQVEMLIVKSAT